MSETAAETEHRLATIDPPLTPVVVGTARAANSWLQPPRTLTEAMELATMFSRSSFVPQEFRGKPGDVLCAIQYGAEVGVPPLQSLQGIAVVNGRPSLFGDLAMAVIESAATEDGSKLLVDKEEFFEIAPGVRVTSPTEFPDMLTAVCVMQRRGRPRPCIRRFSVADAKRAKTREGNATIALWDKATYKQYPQRMLAMRARAWCQRDEFSDVLKGLSIREEADDIDVTATAPPTIETPRAIDEKPAFITDQQRRELTAACHDTGRTHGELRKYLAAAGIASMADIPSSLFPDILAWAKDEPHPLFDGASSAPTTPPPPAASSTPGAFTLTPPPDDPEPEPGSDG